jgi:hypothetical protein
MPAFRRLRQEECKFKAILGYIVRLFLEKIIIKMYTEVHTRKYS